MSFEGTMKTTDTKKNALVEMCLRAMCMGRDCGHCLIDLAKAGASEKPSPLWYASWFCKEKDVILKSELFQSFVFYKNNGRGVRH